MTCSPGVMGGGERMGLEIASLAFSAFAFGFTLCNGIWVFFGPSAQEKRERRKCERSKGDQDMTDIAVEMRDSFFAAAASCSAS